VCVRETFKRKIQSQKEGILVKLTLKHIWQQISLASKGRTKYNKLNIKMTESLYIFNKNMTT